MAIVFQEPKTGRMQSVGENERVRISTLKRLGWKQVKDVAAQSEPAGVVTIAEELTPERIGDPVLAVTEIPVKAVDPDGDELSLEGAPEADEGDPLAHRPIARSKRGL